MTDTDKHRSEQSRPQDIYNETRTVHDNMVKYGSESEYGESFVRRLANLILYSGHDNLHRIRNAWPDSWEKYLNMEKHK